MTRESRKLEHIRYALSIGQSGHNGLEDVRFVHNPIPDASLSHISINTRIGDLDLSSPILINAMTGGAEETERINRDLALAAGETGVAMALGSQMAAIRDPRLSRSFRVAREVNPKGVLFANLGSEATVDQALRAVDMIGADGLQIHLNAVQELVMPEGDRSFTGMLRRIEAIVEKAGVPVIVKEVGFGMTAEAAERLLSLGVAAVDCGGRGGTNFSAIENARRLRPLEWFDDWGNSTAVSLLETLTCARPEQVIATGGIRNALEAAKALSLGAGAVGIAGRFLRVWSERGTEGLAEEIRRLHDELKTIMTALGAEDLAALRRRALVITGPTAEWCRLRGIPLEPYARRGRAAPPVE